MAIKAFEVENYDQQLILLKDLINQLSISSHPEKKLPTIGVIAKKHNTLESVATLLNNYNIPVKYEKSDNILEYTHIKWIIQIMRFCQEFNQSTNYRDLDPLVQEIISFPLWGVDSIILFDLSIQVGTNQKEDKDLNYLNSMLSFEASKTANQTIGQETVTSQTSLIHNISKWLIELGTNSPNLSIGQILDVILGVDPEIRITSTDEDLQELYEEME